MGDKVEFLGEVAEVTAELRVGFRNRSVTSILLEGFAKDTPFFLIVGGALAFCIYRQLLTGSIICLVLLVGWPAFKISLGLPLILFKRLTDARDWKRDEEVFRLVNQIRSINRYHFVKTPEAELIRAEANALARQGRLADAIKLHSTTENQPGVAPWLYKAYLAAIYDSAGDHEPAIRLTEEAIAIRPDPVLYIDYANRLARYRNDAPSARAALEHVDMGLVVEVIKPSVARLRGIIAWLERDYEAARRELETAITGMEKTRHIPFRTGNISVAKGYLCCVQSKLGNTEAARKSWHEAKSYLVATKETDLIKACEHALSGARDDAERLPAKR
jgi:tetratricopeptide (TPR) repeat protein